MRRIQSRVSVIKAHVSGDGAKYRWVDVGVVVDGVV